MKTERFRVSGLHCASCVRRLETSLAEVPGVVSARVNLADASATLSLSGPEALDGALVAANQTGYPMERQTEDSPHEDEADALWRSACLAAILVLPVFIVEMGGHVFPGLHHLIARTIGTTTSWIIQFGLVGLALVGPGRQFFRIGVPALLRGQPEMNSLVALGTGAAFLYSTLATFLPGLLPQGTRNVYFEAAGVIVVLILVGRWLEARAKGRANDAITSLIALQPKTACVVVDGVDHQRPVQSLVPGDILRLRPGERVPTDGIVREGRSTLDESMMTGESIPVTKGPGDAVVGGTVNGTGALLFEASHVGSDTVLAQIIRMVQTAQSARLPVEALVDRVTAVFVPAVLAIALVTVGVWLFLAPEFALVAGVSVLIVACPCAMGLAVPVSIMTGSGRAAELGVLFRQGDALQRLAEVETVAFDKTGTLTQGAPELTHVALAEGFDRARVLALAAAVEANSEHPIGRAITAAAGTRPEATDFETVTGHGAMARVEGQLVRVGSTRMMNLAGLDTGALAEDAEARAGLGETVVFLSVDDKVAAALAVADPVKDSAGETLRSLHASGLKTVMITGDRIATARAIADRLGIDDVTAEALPEAKVDTIRALADASRTAFVGDGINDAPALASAHVGIAIGSGTDVAIEAADVVLMSGDLRGVTRALALSRETMRNIRQNLGWAFGYNILLIPVAAGVFYPATGLLLSPMLAAAAMALSSIAVVTNALRLKRSKGLLT